MNIFRYIFQTFGENREDMHKHIISTIIPTKWFVAMQFLYASIMFYSVVVSILCITIVYSCETYLRAFDWECFHNTKFMSIYSLGYDLLNNILATSRNLSLWTLRKVCLLIKTSLASLIRNHFLVAPSLQRRIFFHFESKVFFCNFISTLLKVFWLIWS